MADIKKVAEAMREVEEKSKAFTASHQGESAEEILAQMRGENQPKFGVGDWIVNNEDGSVGKITMIINNDGFVYDHTNGFFHCCFEDKYHLWTIQDARKGDMLVDVYGNIGIYQKHDAFDWRSYCSLGCNGGFKKFIVEHEIEGTSPATAVQRDLLFAKMREAEYEWDAEKKELKLLITNGGDFEQKQEWSEEDAMKAAGEYKNFRESCGLTDPIALDEIQEAYYQGATSSKQDPCEEVKTRGKQINDGFHPLVNEEIDLWIKENENIHHNDKNIVGLMRDMAYQVSALTKNLYSQKPTEKQEHCEEAKHTEYSTMLQMIWDKVCQLEGKLGDIYQVVSKPYQYFPYSINDKRCWFEDGTCMNPHRDCINCPRLNIGGYTTTSTNIKEE